MQIGAAMFKCIIGFFAGVILTGALFMGPLSVTPAKGQTDGFNLAEMLPDLAKTFERSLASPMYAVGEEIQDNDTGQLYRKLLHEYELDEPYYKIARAEHSSLVDVLPDIKKINKAAITLPLQEAGKNIHDEEIAQFYYKLLESAGWEIVSK